MNKAFELILERIDKEIPVYTGKTKEIVQEVAEEYKDGWISCSDRLPEDGTTILVQDFEEYYEVCNCETRNGVKGFSSGDWWSSANNYIAWQPLPQPYQPKGE